jgi:ATP sulfurylase
MVRLYPRDRSEYGDDSPSDKFSELAYELGWRNFSNGFTVLNYCKECHEMIKPKDIPIPEVKSHIKHEQLRKEIESGVDAVLKKYLKR